MMIKKIMKKSAVFVGTAALSLAMLTGCNSNSKNNVSTAIDSAEIKTSTDTAMTVDGMEISIAELKVYALLQILDGETDYAGYVQSPGNIQYKTINTIAETKVMYNVAKQEGLEFNDEDKETREQLIASFKSYLTEDVMEKYDISDELIEAVFEQTTYVDKYKNDKQNEIGQRLQEEYEEEYKDYNFQSLYYMNFPIVEVDADGNQKTDEEGNLIPVSVDAKKEVRANIDAALDEIKAGADAAETAKKYGVDIYSEETMGYVGEYDDELNDELGSLKAGGCTEVRENDRCYYIIAVLTDHDTALMESYALYMAKQEYEQEYEDMMVEKVKATGFDSTKDVDENLWNNFNMDEMVNYLHEKGLFY